MRSSPTSGCSRWPSPALTALALVFLGGCPDRGPSGTTASKTTAPGAAKTAVTPERRLSSSLSLLKVASRAECDRQGLLMDLGTPDQHKYLVANDRKRLGSAGDDAGTTFQRVRQGTELVWHGWRGGVRRLVIRLRAPVAPIALHVHLGGRTLGPAKVAGDWTVVDLPIEPPLPAGRWRAVLDLDGGDDAGSEADIDWVWLARTDGEPPTLRRTLVSSFNGEPRRSLVADSPSRFSYYLEVPRDAVLTFATAAESAVDFAVSVKTEGQKARKLHGVRAFPGEWRAGRVDLRRYAGKLIRLDLVTRGKPGAAVWGEPAVLYNGGKPAPPAPAAGKRADNLVVVLVDAARADMHRCVNQATDVRTPAVTTLARQGVTFTRAYANANYTLASVASFFSGRNVRAFFPDGIELPRVPASLPLLPEHLASQGFDTAAVVANPYISKPFGLHRGWGKLSHCNPLEEGCDARHVFDSAISWLRARHGGAKETPDDAAQETGKTVKTVKDVKDVKDAPSGKTGEADSANKRFLLYVHTMEPHDPYIYQGAFTDPFLKAVGKRTMPDVVTIEKVAPLAGKTTAAAARGREEVRALYKGELAFHDHHFGRLLQELHRLGLMKNTMVVYMADHGEALFEHGDLGHRSSFHDEQVRVPLVVYHPHLYTGGARVDELVSLLDLAPSLLEGLGLEGMAGQQGRSLRPVMAGRRDAEAPPVMLASEGEALVLGRHKLMGTGEKAQLFNLVRDPGETVNRRDAEPLALRLCEVHLGEARAVPDPRRRLSAVTDDILKPEKAEFDATTHQQLKALGYID